MVGNAIDSGAKHFVIAYDKDWPNNNKLEKLSKKIRYNKELFPNGINIDFYKITENEDGEKQKEFVSQS